MALDYDNTPDLLNNYNLTGVAYGTSVVPSISLNLDLDDHYVVTYTFLRSFSDITGTGYYGSTDNESLSLISSMDYSSDIENAIEDILSPTGVYSFLFADIANINFYEETSGTGIIAFGQANNSFNDFSMHPNVAAGTYRYDPILQNSSDKYGDVFINMNQDAASGDGFDEYNIWQESGSIEPGTRGYKVLIEEISQSLGIDIFDSSNTIRNADLDNNKYTITSYNPHSDMHYETTTVLGPFKSPIVIEASGNPFPAGLQLFDIAALQEIYGRNYDTRNTNTTYDHSGAFASSLADDAFVYTIWDGGGEDTIDASYYDVAAQIDLRQGHFSSIGTDGNDTAIIFDNLTTGYDAGNVAIAFHTVIENAIGTSENDMLIGNAWKNHLEGGSGNDILYGDGIVYDNDAGFTAVESSNPDGYAPSSDDDILDGGDGDDWLLGGSGTDIIYGQDGNDTLYGNGTALSLDGDTFDGGNDIDRLSYFYVTGARRRN